MKNIMTLFLALAVLAVSIHASAGSIREFAPFNNMSAASTTVKNSSAMNVRGYKTKTLQVSGVTLASSLTSITFKNMSGTLVARCAPTSTGPWTNCVNGNYAQTAVSMTANGTFTWDDATNYVRLQWTSGTVGGKLKAWLTVAE